MQTVFVVGDEPIEGYKLVESLGGSAFYRLWKVRAPDGSYKQWKEIDLVVGNAAVETRTLGLLVQLKHQNLNTLTNFWQLDEGRTLVIETQLPMMTLRDRLAQYKQKGMTLPLEEILQYIEQAAKGLDFLNTPRHQHEGKTVAIFHRALTLDSLLLFQEGPNLVCKVSDFGLAKPVTDQNAQHSQGLQHYDYDPPEFFDGKSAATSDQYSLAVNYVEMRTGQLPFPGTMLDQLAAKISDNPNISGIQEPERSVVKRALSSDPDKRYPSSCEFVEDLKRTASGKPASPSAFARPMPEPIPAPAPAPPPMRPADPPGVIRHAPPSGAGMGGGGQPTPGVVRHAPPPGAFGGGGEQPGIIRHAPPPGVEPAPQPVRRPPSPTDIAHQLRHGPSQAATHDDDSRPEKPKQMIVQSDDKKIPVTLVVVILIAIASAAAYVMFGM